MEQFMKGVLTSFLLAGFAFSSTAQQTPKVPRIGVLWHAGSAAEEGAFYNELEQGFRDQGYVIGKTIVLEHRFPNEIPEKFDSLAAELVALQPDVILASGTKSALAIQRRTSNIPLVFVAVGDPIAVKLVNSLSRPGANITGLSMGAHVDISTKRVQLLKEALPSVVKVAVLFDPQSPSLNTLEAVTNAAIAQNLQVQQYPASKRDDFEPAFAAMTKSRADALLVLASNANYSQRSFIASLALKNKLPTMSPYTESAQAGGLMSYAPNIAQQFRRAGFYVSRILKGAMPADLPVELPTHYEFVVNQKTAKALGVQISKSVLVRVDQMID